MCWPRDDQMAHKILFIHVSVFLKESIWISEQVKDFHSLTWAGIIQSTEGLIENKKAEEG